MKYGACMIGHGGTARGALCALALAGVAPAPAVTLPGDLNCDTQVTFDDINPFVLALADPPRYHAAYPDCTLANGDLNQDGAVNFDDINPFVALLAGTGPRLAGQRHSDCVGDGDCPPDLIELTVFGHNLHVRHENAKYNCCIDDLVIRFTQHPDLLHFDEQEVLTNPCYCACCFEAEAWVIDLPPGPYRVEFCWFEYDLGQIVCDVQQIVIP